MANVAPLNDTWSLKYSHIRIVGKEQKLKTYTVGYIVFVCMKFSQISRVG